MEEFNDSKLWNPIYDRAMMSRDGRIFMETGINIRVNGENVDIGDPALDIVVLTEYVISCDHLQKIRLIMSLLNRRKEFDEYMQK